MCGIAGICDSTGLSPADRQALPEMVATLHHRGPDDSGLYYDAHCALGHARLSIIDLAGGRQPMCNEDGTVWVAFNGEIYNFVELRKRLIAAGHRFTTQSDTEVIVHLYEQAGPWMLEELDGMFAIAVWDTKRRRLLLARDRVGIKPLYYHRSDTRMVFGSELKAVLQAGVPKRLRPDALLDYLCYLYVPSPKTILQDVEKLEPGWAGVWEDGVWRQFQYWDVPTDSRVTGDEQALVDDLGRHVRRAVDRRLVSDVPLGAFLSGGLDSSTIVGTMGHLIADPVATCSIGFEDAAFDELTAARMVAKQFATDHCETIVQPEAVDVVEKLAWHYDEPFADQSAIPTYYVSQAARQRVTVALSGDGGDENFGGYRRYRFAMGEQRVRSMLPDWLRRRVFGAAARACPKADWLPKPLRARSTLANLSADPDRAYFQSVTQLDGDTARYLLSGDLRSQVTGYDPYEVLGRHFRACKTDDVAARCMYADLKTNLPDGILCKVDRASMACSLEVRVPLLDHRVVEFAAGLPTAMKIRNGSGKWALKELARPMLGDEIVDRRKQGFNVPMAQWLRGPLKAMGHDLLLASDSGTNAWLDRRQVRRLWQQHQSGLRDNSATLWAMLTLELWAQRFMTATRTPGKTRSIRPVMEGVMA